MPPRAHPVATDTSQYQPAYDHTYPRSVRIFRATFGAHYLDPRFLANANDTARAYAAGECVGAVVYGVWLRTATPREHLAFLKEQFGGKVPDWLMAVEWDYETWRGQSSEQHGDPSGEANELFTRTAHWMGAWTASWGYGNPGDLAELIPHRDKRMLIDEAGYRRTLNLTVAGAIAQQYTDGQTRWGVPAGYPHSSPPFGPCDHNAFLGVKNGRQLRAAIRPLKPKHQRPPTGTGTGTGSDGTGHPTPKPYPHPAARSAAALIGAQRESALFLRGGHLELERHGKVVATWPPKKDGSKA